MRTEEQDDTPNYEVGQEQLDAVDRMLEELDLDDRFDRVERFEQQHQQQQHQSRVHGHHHHHHHSFNTIEQDEDTSSQTLVDRQSVEDITESDTDRNFQDEMDERGEEEDLEPVGYIPLGQGENSDDDDDDLDNNGDENGNYMEMQSDDEDTNDDDGGQGYDGYLRSPTGRHGEAPVPVIPQAVQIELEGNDDHLAVERIPEEDLKTIAMVMSSISLPMPDWAKSIPEERWMPRIVQQAKQVVGSSPSSPSSSSSDPAGPSSSVAAN